MRTSLDLKLMTFAVCAILTLFIDELYAQVAPEKEGVAAVVQQDLAITGSEGLPLVLEGINLSPGQASDLEKIVAQAPYDLKSQTLLLGFYFPQPIQG